jgi:predicted phage terminase large subunit-like protein
MEARSEDDALGRAIGERLWPEWYTEEQVAEAKENTRKWSALYQQTPVIEEGDYFKAAWLKTEYEQIPDNAHYYGASDYAVTEGHGDFTEHGIFALDAFGNIYVVDWWRGQTTADVWIEHQIDLINEYEPLLWFGEAGPIRRATEPYLVLRMSEREAHCRMEWLPSIGDKATRLRERGKVFFPKTAAWKAELLQQLTRFPAARYDDGVDVCSLIGRGLDLIKAPRKSGWNKVQPIVADPNAGAQAWMTH